MKLALDGLTKSFGARRVLEAATADFGELRTLALIGPSGGGKSTLLRILAGLELPDSGAILLDGAPVAATREYRRELGVVFQAYNLFPHLTALENLELPLEKVHGLTTTEARKLALATLERFHL